MQEKPFAKIIISEILIKAEVSRPTFYLYFESKEHLLISLFDEMFDTLVEELEEIYLSEDYRPGLSAEHIIHYLAGQHENFQILLKARVGHLVSERLKSIFINVSKQWRQPVSSEESIIRPYALDFFTGGIYLAIVRWIEEGMQMPIEPLAQMIADVEIALIDFGLQVDQNFQAKKVKLTYFTFLNINVLFNKFGTKPLLFPQLC